MKALLLTLLLASPVAAGERPACVWCGDGSIRPAINLPCCEETGGDHDQDYNRTGTKPPAPPGDWFVGVGVGYGNDMQLSPSGTIGYRFGCGLDLALDVEHLRLNAVDGAVTYDPDTIALWAPVPIAYTTGAQSTTEFRLGVRVPFKLLKKPAK